MSHIPSKDEILQWIADNPGLSAKRDIAKAFGIKGAARIDLKRVLRELEDEGHLEKRKKTYRDPDRLPPVSVLLVNGPDANGDLTAKPLEWQGEGEEPVVHMVLRGSDPALGAGDRILARLTLIEHGPDYEGRLIRRIGHNPKRILGIFRAGSEGGRIVPIDKGADLEWMVPAGATHGAKDGELVEAEQAGPKARMGLPRARVVSRLGDPTAPKAVSLIAIHQHGIPDDFPDEVIEEADRAKPAGLKGREDLRDLPFVTIDPSDARDHDDACYAHADDDPKNEGGHVLWVAIADVAHYVRPGTALDREARKRGNSTYFPDRVVPMLPDRLSGDLCSLHEGVPRPCIAVRMRLDAHGVKIGHSFHRGLMRSAASLAYEEVQAAMDGSPNDKCGPLLDDVIRPLYAAYDALKEARNRRQPLDLDLPERKIVLSDEGEVLSVRFRDRLDAHKLIEEFMVLANVCAAETLEKHQRPCVYRVHDQPDEERVEGLKDFLDSLDLPFNKGQVLHARLFNRVLGKVRGTALEPMVNESVLRSQSQAYYSVDNLGHFGLSLPKYAHFTSPIRRYADLLVHRALIDAHKFGPDGLGDVDREQIESFAEQTSQNERRAMLAERDANDRFTAIFLSDRVGEIFEGRISGVTKYGLFITLHETGASGLVPMRSLPNDYYHVDEQSQMLVGERHGRAYRLGSSVAIRLVEAVPVTGGLTFEMLHGEGHETVDTSKMRLRGPRKKQARPHRGRRGPRRR